MAEIIIHGESIPVHHMVAAELLALRARVKVMENDLEAAAGELLLPIPEPGTDMAKMMSANAIMRRRVAELEAHNTDLAHMAKGAIALGAKRTLEAESLRAVLRDLLVAKDVTTTYMAKIPDGCSADRDYLGRMVRKETQAEEAARALVWSSRIEP